MIIKEQLTAEQLLNAIEFDKKDELLAIKEKYQKPKFSLMYDYIFNNYIAYYLGRDVSIDTKQETVYDDIVNMNKETIKEFLRDLLLFKKAYMTYGLSGGMIRFEKLDPLTLTEIMYLDAETNGIDAYAYLRKYQREEYANGEYQTNDYVDVYMKDAMYVYTGSTGSYILVKKYDYVIGEQFSWSKIPIIGGESQEFFKRIFPFIEQIFSIEDTAVSLYNDLPDSFIVIRNYSGTDKATAKQELNDYRIAFVDGDGGMATESLPTDSAAYKIFKEDLMSTFFKLVGLPIVDNFGNASGVALKYLYKQLAMCSQFIEEPLKLAIEEMVAAIREKHNPTDTQGFTVRFNPDVVQDDTALIKNINDSRGLIPDEDLAKHNPFYKTEYVTAEVNLDFYSPNLDNEDKESDEDDDDRISEEDIKALQEASRSGA